ncbi:MAG: NADH-quinone oxidoreductase subunit M [Planctomycetales bacterium]|nr:NADH-quinone oxidoreductase subunit M [Planctomycetales bacterium]
MAQLLLFTICLPMLGAGTMWALAPLGRNAVRWGALAVTLGTLLLAVMLVAQFPADGMGDEEFAVQVGRQAAAQFDVRFSIGLDGLGVWMFGLSALLMVSAVLISWEAIVDRAPLFYGMLLLLECGCLGVFAARDIVLFYVFFEFTLIPLFFLIGIWGSEDRRYAAIKFFLFTLAGSVLTFIGLLAIVLWDYSHAGTGMLQFSIPALTESLTANPMPHNMQCWVFLALLAGFAVKVPLFPLHTWLPLAHVQAPAAGSVFLAGILLKIGTYGFLRFNIPLLPEATITFMPMLLWLSAAGIVYGALAALAQGDMKRLIAYSSVSHLGYCVLGLFALNQIGVQGGALQMINHGLSTGGLFAIIGMLYERYHTREISQLGGLARKTPWLAFFMLVFTFSSIGLPGLNGFAGEFLVLAGIFQRAFAESADAWGSQLKVVTLLALSGVVLGAWYMLWLVQRVFFGPAKEPADAHDVQDMNWREFAALSPLVVFVLWIGLQPHFFLQRMAPALERVTQHAEQRLEMEIDAEHLAEANTAVANTAVANTKAATSAAPVALAGSAQTP